MNLTEALDEALPELPAQRALKRFPKLHSKLRWREHLEDGVPVIMAHLAGSSDILRFTKAQWDVAQLFDGQRSYQEVADAYREQTNVAFEEAALRSFAATLRDNGLLQQTAGEQYAVAHKQKHLRSRKKSRWSDVAHIDFPAWDPDGFLNWIHPHLRFLYSSWFTLLTLCLFSFMIYVFAGHWSEIGRDTLTYYNFTKKGVSDLAEFWILFFFLGFVHESAHALTCKHYGGGVHRMGFLLLYLQPCFFVDTSESYVYATRWQRLAIIIAGIWVELIFCALASIVWWGTVAGSYGHELAYKVMLITGAAVVVLNMNPLIKLDGYYFFCELIGISDFKEQSTAFVSSWIKRNLSGLPVEVEYVNPRRRRLFVAYALLSGAYGYLLLLAFVQFAFNVMRSFNPQWAFVPALFLFYMLFRSRLRKLGTFMKTVYLDKKDLLRPWSTVPRLLLCGIALAALLFVPWRRESIEGRFALEPAQHAVVHAELAGHVSRVYVDEGSRVAAGAPLIRLQNLTLEARAGAARADAQVAAAHATEAQLKYSNFGLAQREKEETSQRSGLLAQQEAMLNLVSPISGIVTTPRLRDLLGASVKAGDSLVEVANFSSMRARVYVPEALLERVCVGAKAVIKPDMYVGSISSRVESLAPAATDIEPGLVHKEDYKGIRAPTYYVAMVLIPNKNGQLFDGSSGTAKIYSTRRSLAGLAWREIREFLGLKIW